MEIKVPVKPTDISVTLPSEIAQKKTSRSPITEKEFINELQTTAGPEAVEFARWVLDNAEDHNLQVDWGDAGPMLKYLEPLSGNFFTFGQLRRDGLFTSTERLYERFVKLGLPLEICRDYFDEVAQMVPNAFRQRITTKSGKFLGERLCYGKKPIDLDYPPLIELSPHKEKLMEEIDKAIQRIREVLDNE